MESAKKNFENKNHEFCVYIDCDLRPVRPKQRQPPMLLLLLRAVAVVVVVVVVSTAKDGSILHKKVANSFLPVLR